MSTSTVRVTTSAPEEPYRNGSSTPRRREGKRATGHIVFTHPQIAGNTKAGGRGTVAARYSFHCRYRFHCKTRSFGANTVNTIVRFHCKYSFHRKTICTPDAGGTPGGIAALTEPYNRKIWYIRMQAKIRRRHGEKPSFLPGLLTPQEGS